MINTDFLHCTGCGACVQVCPIKCITFAENEDGFIYPSVNKDNCVDCKKCESVCPINKELNISSVSKAYACVSNNKRHLMKGTSGGIFGVIADYVLSQGGVVYGCAFDRSLKAKHIRIDCIKDLEYIYGSKYVQSDINNCFQKARADLKEGKEVLFSGTPCQIAGLLSFLGKKYENLITIDIICHGVPSQSFFTKYIKWLSVKEKGSIVQYSFRSKTNKGWSLSGYYTIKNGENVCRKPLYYFEHYYYFYFLQSLIYRESCYECKFATIQRQGDITLGDLWGVEGMNLNMDVDNGCSLVLLNSEKAISLLKRISIDSVEISIDEAIKYNEQLRKPSHRPDGRDALLKQFRTMSGLDIQRRFCIDNRQKILLARIKYLVPKGIKKIIQKKRYSK